MYIDIIITFFYYLYNINQQDLYLKKTLLMPLHTYKIT